MAGSLCPAPMCGGATIRRFGLPARHAATVSAFNRKALHADADARRTCVEALLCVVRAEHDDQQIDRLMRHQRGIYDIQPGHTLVQRIGKHGRPAGQPLFQHKVLLPQRLLQKAGPAFVLVEAVGAVGGVIGVGTVAVGIGIAEADNVFFHVCSPYYGIVISGSPAEKRRRQTDRHGGTSHPAEQGGLYRPASLYSSRSTRPHSSITSSPPRPDITRPSSSTWRKWYISW